MSHDLKRGNSVSLQALGGYSAISCSEEHELLSNVTFDSLGLNSENIESHSLGEGSALTNGNNITFSDSESG